MKKSRVGLPSRRMAVRILREVLADGRPLDDVLARQNAGLLKSFSGRDRRFVRALVSTSLRRRGQIDDVLSRFLDRPLPRKSGPAREILLTGVAQLLFMETSSHAVIDLAVTLAAEDRNASGFKGLVNAVLRRISVEGKAIIAEQDAPRLNTPEWLWSRWQAQYGEATARRIAETHLSEALLDLTVKSGAEDWARRLDGTVLGNGSVRLDASGRIEKLDGFSDGAWWVQDAAASLPARLLGDVSGLSVLDLCAAPGGKTAQLAAAGARVTAIDRSPERLTKVEENMNRLALTVTAQAADATEFRPDRPPDAILLDAPCSATGTIRRHPDIPWTKREETIGSLAAIQGKMLRHAVDLLAPGGLLIFCTCSLEHEEGPDQIEHLFKNGAPVERVPVMAKEIDGLDDAVSPAGDVRTLPFHSLSSDNQLAGMDGFFIARLRKL